MEKREENRKKVSIKGKGEAATGETIVAQVVESQMSGSSEDKERDVEIMHELQAQKPPMDTLVS